MNRRGFFSRATGAIAAMLGLPVVAKAAAQAPAVDAMGGFLVPPEFTGLLNGIARSYPLHKVTLTTRKIGATAYFSPDLEDHQVYMAQMQEFFRRRMHEEFNALING